jgi:hypothetical protein
LLAKAAVERDGLRSRRERISSAVIVETGQQLRVAEFGE